MKNVLSCSVVLIVLSVASGVANQARAKDKVKIINIAPSSPVTSSAESEIKVEVGYRLESKEEGEIALGFNTKSPHSFIIEDEVLVRRGRGRVTLRAKVKAVDWKGQAPFNAYVIISESPHAGTWVPLASTVKKIKVKPE